MRIYGYAIDEGEKMIDVNDIRNGMTLQYEGNIYQVIEFLHVKPGKGSAYMKTKLQNLRNGSTIERTFNTNVKFEDAHINRIKVQFLYEDNGSYNFMDNNTYDQFELTSDQIGDKKDYLLENMELDITKFGNEILGISLPEKIEFDGNNFRTVSMNSVLGLIYQQTNELRGGNKKSEESFSTFPASVPRAGIEPARISPLVFETNASTYSAIWAYS